MSDNDSWTRWAKCQWMDPDLFDSDNYNKGRSAKGRLAAVELCKGCPVLMSCAAAAIDEGACGVVRAGVAIGINPYDDERFSRLRYLLEHGHHPPETEPKRPRRSGLPVPQPPRIPQELLDQHEELVNLGLKGRAIATKLDIPLHNVHYLNKKLKRRRAAAA